MLFLYRFFCGVLELEFYGVYPEKVLTLCAKNRISLWSGQYKNRKIRCFIAVKDFLKLPKILRGSGIRVHILRKKGFPFFIKKYKARFGIVAGFILLFAFLQIMSGYIWIIDVVGNQSVSEKSIISACEELGIKVGTRSSNIDTKNDAQNLLLKLDTLAWGSLNIEGCKLTVNVTEITKKEQDNSVATNLKASADGIITHIDVTSGNCVVKVGEPVFKGDILVSGIIENLNGTKFVHSAGVIEAQTNEEVSFSEDFIQKLRIPSGKVKTKTVLEVFGLKIPLYIGKEKGFFETQSQTETIKLFSQNIPIKLYKKRFVFENEIERKYTYEQLCKKLEERLNKEYASGVKEKNFIKNDRGVTLKAVISEKKNIAISENIIFNIGN